jgi:hypothetical protein
MSYSSGSADFHKQFPIWAVLDKGHSREESAKQGRQSKGSVELFIFPRRSPEGLPDSVTAMRGKLILNRFVTPIENISM